MVATKQRKDNGLGLDGIGDLSALLNTTPERSREGKPIELPIDIIDEDPNQPRTEDNPGFTEESLDELAATIKPRGVKSPISVRDNPKEEGRYIINHGARRYRASIIAGKKSIPSFVDNDYLEEDQVIENLQRNELTPREIADFIGRMLAAGKKKRQIAKSIGKSPAFISQHVTLLDLPEPIAEAFSSGRAKDVTVINELVTAHKKSPDEVESWLMDESQEMTRGSVKLLREFLEEKAEEGAGDNLVEEVAVEGGTEHKEEEEKEVEKKAPDPEKLKKAIIQVSHDDRPARLILNRRPAADGYAWLKYDDDGHEFEASLTGVVLVSIIEG